MKSRIESTKKNVFYGAIGKIFLLVCKFALRSSVIAFLGAAYLGLDGLFLNVLAVLSVAELGIGNAICFALYEPLAKQNSREVAQYLSLYNKVYRLLGMIILLFGLLLIPFLKYIVNYPTDVQINYQLIYIFFLLNTALSYFCGAYRSVLFTADQRNYYVTNIQNAISAVTIGLQIVAIVLTQNYYLYLIIMCIGTALTNVILAYSAKEEYPQAFTTSDIGPLSPEKKHLLKKNVFALALTKVSTVIYTSSDNIVISSFIGTLVVGYYSNYAYTVSAVTGIIALVFSALTASVGNAYVSMEPKQMHNLFKRTLFANVWIYGVGFTCLLLLFQDFIACWAGYTYLLSNFDVLLITLMFLLPGLGHSCTIFKDACGLFWFTRYRTVATALTNILISIILSWKIGLPGVFIGTIVSFLVTTFPIDSKIVYREVFKMKNRSYFQWYFQSVLFISGVTILVYLVIRNIEVTGWISMIGKAFLCFILTNIIYMILLRKKSEFVYFKEVLRNVTAKRRK